MLRRSDFRSRVIHVDRQVANPVGVDLIEGIGHTSADDTHVPELAERRDYLGIDVLVSVCSTQGTGRAEPPFLCGDQCRHYAAERVEEKEPSIDHALEADVLHYGQ